MTPPPVVKDAFRRGEFDLEGGTEDERAFIRDMLTGRFTLTQAGDCAHCGLPIEESRMWEDVTDGSQWPVTILAHIGSGDERCEGRDTTAERTGPEEQ